jgi:Rrf2 family protein
MITQTAEYALRAVVYLADQHPTPQTVAQIAKVTLVPAGYLSKVMQGLGRAGLVKSQRGIKGGFMLALDPQELTVLEVVNAVEPIRRFPECPLGIVSHGRRLCPLHKRLDEAGQLVEDTLRQSMVADMLEGPRTRKPLCRFPTDTDSPG